MKKSIAGLALLLLSTPLSAWACNGSIVCAVRRAPREVVDLLPGFFSSHAGLLGGTAVSAVIVGILLSRQDRAEVRDEYRRR